MAFKKIDEEGVLPGPRAVFISGYPLESMKTLETFLKEKGLENIKLVQARTDHVGMTVGEVLTGSSTAELVPPEKLPPVMLWSGIAHLELDQIIKTFRENGLPRPIFATTTKGNMSFDIRTLIRHLLEDQREIQKAQQKMMEAARDEKPPVP